MSFGTPKYEVVFFTTSDGFCPYKEWVDSLKDKRGSAKIDNRVTRLSEGNLGNNRFLAADLCELKFKKDGPGYRVYCGIWGNKRIIILAGGDKTTQNKDIKRAQDYWDEYKQRNREK